MLACTSRSFSAPRDPTKQVDLEEIVGQRVESFAFPYDNCAPKLFLSFAPLDLDRPVLWLRRSHGRASNRFELPRHKCRIGDAEMFPVSLAKQFFSIVAA